MLVSISVICCARQKDFDALPPYHTHRTGGTAETAVGPQIWRPGFKSSRWKLLWCDVMMQQIKKRFHSQWREPWRGVTLSPQRSSTTDLSCNPGFKLVGGYNWRYTSKRTSSKMQESNQWRESKKMERIRKSRTNRPRKKLKTRKRKNMVKKGLRIRKPNTEVEDGEKEKRKLKVLSTHRRFKVMWSDAVCFFLYLL